MRSCARESDDIDMFTASTVTRTCEQAYHGQTPTHAPRKQRRTRADTHQQTPTTQAKTHESRHPPHCHDLILPRCRASLGTCWSAHSCSRNSHTRWKRAAQPCSSRTCDRGQVNGHRDVKRFRTRVARTSIPDVRGRVNVGVNVY
jgi:hypothetical protein